MDIVGYDLRQKLHESNRTLVYRAVRFSDGRPVVLKIVNSDRLEPDHIARLRYEFAIGGSLGIEGISSYLEVLEQDDAAFLVMEDRGASSLAMVLYQEGKPLPLSRFLPVAIQAASILGKVHSQKLIHKDINPSNLLLCPGSGHILLIDFDLSTFLASERYFSFHQPRLEGTLAYISPEQTGRMNRGVDYRTDIYSFGITLYELLTGRPPFLSDDPLELVHCHLARPVPSLLQTDPSLPPALSRIIAKATEKRAEDRYQSAFGLMADLERCARMLAAGDSAVDFAPGMDDFSERFQIPQRIYGREAECQSLLSAFEKSREGPARLLFISGNAGVGKSSLVNEIHKELAGRQGFFAAGKFDPLQKNTPYSAWRQGFAQVLDEMNGYTPERREAWRRRIQEAVGPNGRIITDVLPEALLLIGAQPELPLLGPNEAQNRFNHVFYRFISAFADGEHPLVIFLDDAQWADAASLKFLEYFFRDAAARHVLVLVSYRDNEVDGAHPLRLLLGHLETQGVTAPGIALAPLAMESVRALLDDALRKHGVEIDQLAAICFEKTRGNPFFLAQFLEALHRDGLIRFAREERGFAIELERIREKGYTDNAVDLLVSKIRELPDEEQRALRLAACLGSQFELTLLSPLLGVSQVNAAVLLQRPLEQSLITPSGGAYRYVHDDTRERIAYRFVHDRIHQAAYSLLGQADRARIHLEVARWLLAHLDERQKDERLFEIVHHLEHSQALLRGSAERFSYLTLLLSAGKRARESAAFDNARRFLLAARELSQRSDWDEHYVSMLALFTEAAEAAYLSGQYPEMDELIEEARGQTRDLLDQVSLVEIRLQALITQGQLEAAIETGREALSWLGVRFPRRATLAHAVFALLAHQLRHGRRDPMSWLESPDIVDERIRAAERLMVTIGSPAFLVDANFYVLLVLKSFVYGTRYGICPHSAVPFTGIGVLLCGIIGDIERGYGYGQLALKTMERFGERRLFGYVQFVVATFTEHWKKHVKETLPQFLQAYQCALETGDHVFMCHAAFNYCYTSYLAGKELNLLEREFADFAEAVRRVDGKHVLCSLQIYHQTVQNLMGKAKNPCRLVGRVYDEDAARSQPAERNERILFLDLHYNKMVLCFLFHDLAEAYRIARALEKRLDIATGLFVQPLFHYYDSLIRLAVCDGASRSKRRGELRKVAANQRKLEKWARFARANHQHRYLLVEAERMRVLARGEEAGALYEQAIAQARESGFSQDEALACDLAGDFYLQKDMTRVARAYFQTAIAAYRKWGSAAKVDDLRSSLLDTSNLSGTFRMSSTVESLSPSALCAVETGPLPRTPGRELVSTISVDARNLDYQSLLKAAMTISEEVDLRALLDRLMRTAVENAGADRGILILGAEQRLCVEATLDLNQGGAVVLETVPLDQRADLAGSVVRYAATARKPVILGDAKRRDHPHQDPYITSGAVKSILAIPILRNQSLTGVLYLENHHATDTFTPGHVELLKLLSAQAAISIDNARLVTKLKESAEQLSVALGAAQESARVKQELLARISHELRTPLNAIVNLPEIVLERRVERPAVHCKVCESLFERTPGDEGAESLLRDPCPHCGARDALETMRFYFYDGDSAELFSIQEIIQSSGRKLLGLVTNFLDLAEAKNKEIELELSDVAVGALVSQVLSQARPQAQKSGISLAAVPIPEDLTVRADYLKLGKVIYNLIDNAIKFSPRGSQVEVSATRLPSGVSIEIKDQGIGIDKKDHELIFESFRQVEEGTNRRYGGSGLGLAVAKSLVELHQGAIWVESELGRGSTFHVLMQCGERRVDAPR